jgi:ABC-2 type transport system permease protein
MYLAKLYFRYVVLQLKAEMEYRATFFPGIFMQMFGYISSFFTIWVLFSKFNSIGNWGFYEVAFLYSLNLITYSISSAILWSPMMGIETKVQQGEFDSVLCKPINPLLHLIGQDFNYIFLSNIAVAVVMLGITFSGLSIVWTPSNVMWFIVVIIGGALIQSAILIISGSISFWFVKSNSVVNTFIYSIRGFISYPITIYGIGIQVLLTFIIPYAFVNFYPSQLFLDKSGSDLFFSSFKYGTPIVGIIMFVLAIFIWNVGVNKYESTGS